MHAYIKSSGFIGGKGSRSLKKLPFCQTTVMLDYMCVQSFVITNRQCFMLIVKYKVTSGKNHFHEMNGDVGMAGWK